MSSLVKPLDTVIKKVLLVRLISDRSRQYVAHDKFDVCALVKFLVMTLMNVTAYHQTGEVSMRLNAKLLRCTTSEALSENLSHNNRLN